MSSGKFVSLCAQARAVVDIDNRSLIQPGHFGFSVDGDGVGASHIYVRDDAPATGMRFRGPPGSPSSWLYGGQVRVPRGKPPRSGALDTAPGPGGWLS